jgi:hypothetical protein
MSKKKTTEAMTMKISIELADNGIIIRNPDCEDDVTLALSRGQYGEDRTDEYNAIGKIVFDWLMNVVLTEQNLSLILPTGFDIDINTKCFGREIL